MKILIAEDARDMQMLFKLFLKDEPIDFEIVPNGEVALNRFIEEKFDIVFMDLNMPEMDGDQAIVKMREWEETSGRERTRVIIMSANDLEAQFAKQFQSIGFDDYMEKPISKRKIVNHLKKVLFKKAA